MKYMLCLLLFTGSRSFEYESHTRILSTRWAIITDNVVHSVHVRMERRVYYSCIHNVQIRT